MQGKFKNIYLFINNIDFKCVNFLKGRIGENRREESKTKRARNKRWIGRKRRRGEQTTKNPRAIQSDQG